MLLSFFFNGQQKSLSDHSAVIADVFIEGEFEFRFQNVSLNALPVKVRLATTLKTKRRRKRRRRALKVTLTGWSASRRSSWWGSSTTPPGTSLSGGRGWWRAKKRYKKKTPMSRRIFASGLASKLQNSQELGSPSKSWRRPAKCKVDNKTCRIAQIEIAFSAELKSLTSWEIRNFLVWLVGDAPLGWTQDKGGWWPGYNFSFSFLWTIFWMFCHNWIHTNMFFFSCGLS